MYQKVLTSGFPENCTVEVSAAVHLFVEPEPMRHSNTKKARTNKLSAKHKNHQMLIKKKKRYRNEHFTQIKSSHKQALHFIICVSLNYAKKLTHKESF